LLSLQGCVLFVLTVLFLFALNPALFQNIGTILLKPKLFFIFSGALFFISHFTMQSVDALFSFLLQFSLISSK